MLFLDFVASFDYILRCIRIFGIVVIFCTLSTGDVPWQRGEFGMEGQSLLPGI